jgi:regulator of extracellular matrix RemA (YlzA/DUF370 family)
VSCSVLRRMVRNNRFSRDRLNSATDRKRRFSVSSAETDSDQVIGSADLIQPKFAAKRRGSGRAGEAFPAGSRHCKPPALLPLQ